MSEAALRLTIKAQKARIAELENAARRKNDLGVSHQSEGGLAVGLTNVDDIPTIKSPHGFTASENAIQAINKMLRDSVILPTGRDGEIIWRAYLDGTEIELHLDRAGRVIGSLITD